MLEKAKAKGYGGAKWRWIEDSSVPHSELDASVKRPVYATPAEQTKRRMSQKWRASYHNGLDGLGVKLVAKPVLPAVSLLPANTFQQSSFDLVQTLVASSHEDLLVSHPKRIKDPGGRRPRIFLYEG